ncbi:MAG: DUF1538 domain-containing protein [Clostridia bacterium]|nr:DUF1538 domain-containing protein [Clostridia bacterium]
MRNAYLSKLKEAVISILPIVCIVLLLGFTLVPMSWQTMVQFLIAAVLLVIGMSCFTLGADAAMLPIGQNIGSFLSKTHKIWLMLLVGFLMGVIITIAEPDLMVLANQVPGIGNWTLIIAVGIGVGLFMMFAVMRTLLKIPLHLILTLAYIAIFVLAIFVPAQFAPLSFDSGSVTTGPISVPFLMAFGLGLAAVRGSKSGGDDSFGLVALGSAGPILAVMILGLFIDPATLTGGTTEVAQTPDTFGGIMMAFLNELPHHLGQVALVLLPILAIFLVFQFTALKLPKKQVFGIIVGIVFVFVGITLFFTGVNVGFLPVGTEIGSSLAGGENSWLLLPIACVIGLVIVLAEPAVHVLTKQVEKMTEGKISSKTILWCMCIGVAISLGFSALRVLFEIPIWYILVPAYIIAITLSFIVPRIFTGIAFDSGGVVTGAMATTFVLPLIMGACAATGVDSMLYGFGTLALIAVTPLLTVQILGLIVKIANKKKMEREEAIIEKDVRADIVEFD